MIFLKKSQTLDLLANISTYLFHLWLKMFDLYSEGILDEAFFLKFRFVEHDVNFAKKKKSYINCCYYIHLNCVSISITIKENCSHYFFKLYIMYSHKIHL